ncbi:hypothetical protein M5K25_003552 [Dendrobium thyrsiflorum]|uniref:Glycerol 3-phosphate permease n=1 Tax=Dendrobium thyrsiflorum TaxID=117978 RepID=A0ABD0VJK4_DENTH
MGIWNSNTSVGNILGSVLASCSFVVPALVIGLVGVLVFACLVPHPRDLALENMDCGVEMNVAIDSSAINDDGLTALLQHGLTEGKSCRGTEGEEEPISFFEAWRLPSVASYACCLFFSKLVAYTFLYWLPFYIRHTAVSGEYLTHKTSGILSTVFDIGGVLGGVLAGFISDWLCAREITSLCVLLTLQKLK